MTCQLRDKLIYRGQHHAIISFTENDFPFTHKEFPTYASNCWKGYVGVWKIKRNLLYLIGLTATAYGNVGVKYLFPRKKSVFADWYDGEIKIPAGDWVGSWSSGSVYERYEILKFEKGVLVGGRFVENKHPVTYEELFKEFSSADL